MIDLQMIAEQGFLSTEEITPPDWMKNEGYIDYSGVVFWKIPVLKTAAQHFIDKISNNSNDFAQSYAEFKEKQAYWIDEYAIFMSIKEFYDAKAKEENRFGAMWSNYWPENLASHSTRAVNKWAKDHANEIEIYKAIQFFFFEQWNNLKNYANSKGISIIGDIPIYVAMDSADTWAHPELFELDSDNNLISVAGCPPDGFSATGQLWGNPLYDWKYHKKTGYEWWIKRIKNCYKLYDVVRIDHFRAFDKYWAVPYFDKDATKGKWLEGPGEDFFKTLFEIFFTV